MDKMINFILFLIGLVLLINGSTYLIKSSSVLAKKLGVSEFVIGLSIIAFGTSIPELTSSVFASFKGASSLIIGTIIGANIANLTLVTGIAAAISKIKMKKEILMRDSIMLIFVLMIFTLALLDKIISRLEGIIFILLYISYFTFIFQSKRGLGEKYGFNEFISYFFKFKYFLTIKNSLIKNYKNHTSPTQKKKTKKSFEKGITREIIIMILSLSAVIFGAKLLVDKAIYFSGLFLFPAFIIGIIISLGTTAPEMSVSISASRKGFGNIAIGNAIGSFITNILLILGCASLISPIKILETNLQIILGSLILISTIFFIFVRTKKEISRIEGASLIMIYFIFLICTLIKLI